MKKISIIVPIYNVEKYIKKCFDSIINQQYKNIEIIAVNDGSTDKSEEIMLEYAEKYPQIIKCFNKPNGGLSDARNFGIDKATGDYIAFVDADDYLNLTLFSGLKNYIEGNYEIIKYKMIKVDEKGNELEKVYGPIFENKTGEDAFNDLRIEDKLMVSACLYLLNLEFYKKNRFEFTKNTYHEDFGLIPLILLKANKVASTDIYGYYYVQSAESITRNTPYEKTVKRAKDLFVHYDNMLEYIAKNPITQITKDNIKMFYTNAILLKVKELKGKEEKEYINKIKKDRLIRNIKIRNLKQLIKKILLHINIKLYLKMR